MSTKEDDKRLRNIIKSMSTFSALASMELTMDIRLTQEEADKHNISLENFNSVPDFKIITETPELAKKVFVFSPANVLNTMIFGNKSNQEKIFCVLVMLGGLSFKEEEEFLFPFIKSKLADSYMHIKQKFVIQEESVVTLNLYVEKQKKTVVFKCVNQVDEDVKPEEDENFLLRVREEISMTNCFLGDLDYFLKLKAQGASLDWLREMLKALYEDNPNILNILFYPDILEVLEFLDEDSILLIKELFSLTDIFIFEKNEIENFYVMEKSMTSEEPLEALEKQKNKEIYFLKDVEKFNKKHPKIAFFIDELKQVSILQQDADTDLIQFHSDFPLSCVKDDEKSKQIMVIHYKLLRSAYVGTFLQRFAFQITINDCVKAAEAVFEKVFKSVYNKKEPELITDDKYYELKPMGIARKRNKYQELCEKREKEFYLDCVRMRGNSKRMYNSLTDPYLVSYFSRPKIKNLMVRKGLLQRDGKINMDKDVTSRKIELKSEELKVIEQENDLYLDIKENNMMLIRKLNKIANEDISKLKEKNYHEVSKISHIHNVKPRQKKIIPPRLPPIKGKHKSLSVRRY